MIDLRSDTVTQPTPAMREAMANARTGDDVYGEDPTVNRLQTAAAERLGFEDSLFLCSGTQANLVALLSHCQRGDEYIVGQNAHTYQFEGGGAAVLGGIQPQPLLAEPDATLDLEKVARLIKPDDFHFARSRLLCLENTHNGKVLPLEYLGEAADFAKRHRLALHLDGARIFNAAVDLNVDITEISRHFDTLTVCLSKGLCAPVGTLLFGSRDFIRDARRWRKVVGGGMRQAGILAAAAELAITEQVPKLAQDHEKAARLAGLLAQIPGLEVDGPHTNMVFVRVPTTPGGDIGEYFSGRGIRIGGRGSLRLVLHQGISHEDVDNVVRTFREYVSAEPSA